MIRFIILLLFFPIFLKLITVEKYANVVRRFRLAERKRMGDPAYFRKYPERFADEIIGIKAMTKISTLNRFTGFTYFQIEFMRDYLDMKVPRVFIRCNRGGAKSFLLGYCSLLDSYIHHMEGRMWLTTILAGSKKQSNVPFRYARKMVLLSPILRKMTKTTRTNILFPTTYTEIVCLAESDTDVKGPRANVQIIDEVCSTDEQIIEDFWGEMITAQHFKAVVSGTPDDPSHISYQWEHDVQYGYKVHHWNAYDCSTENGGWITPEVIEELKKQYRSIHAYRRNILGEWASYGGSVIDSEFIDAATKNYHVQNLPDPRNLDYVIVCGDPARSGHYATRVTMGVYKQKLYIYNAKGWQHIKEQELREKYMKEAIKYRDILDNESGYRVIVVLEDVPISKALCDNVEIECANEGILFRRSRFGSESDVFSAGGKSRGRVMKNRFVEVFCWFFEEYLIKIPLEFTELIGQVISMRWKKLPGKTSDLTTGKLKKGDDDFVDAAMHGTMEASRYIRYRRTERRKSIAVIGEDSNKLSGNKGNPQHFSRREMNEMHERKRKAGAYFVVKKRSF